MHGKSIECVCVCVCVHACMCVCVFVCVCIASLHNFLASLPTTGFHCLWWKFVEYACKENMQGMCELIQEQVRDLMFVY